MANYIVVRTFTMRGTRYERGTVFHPASEGDAMQLLHLHLIERVRPPGNNKEGAKHGCKH